VGLAEELEATAAAAAAHAAKGETVAAVLPAEPHPGARLYVVAYHGADGRTWLAFDGDGVPVADRVRVRDAVWIAGLCELAGETAGGGDLDELRSHLVAVRVTEAPPGIEEAEAALDELERTIGSPPQLATPERLDAIGAAARRLELALDPTSGSPFAAAMKAAAPSVEELEREVEATYRLELS
jgi:hypothetical protein